MQMQHTALQRAIYELGLLPCYQFEGKNYYDTREVFDRHNFARDVRRNVKPEDWLFLKPRYLLTEHGIVQFAFRKTVNKLIDKFMTVLDRPLIQDMPAMPYLPRPDTVIPAIQPQISSLPPQNVKYEHLSPPEDGLVPSTPADYNASWETFEVPVVGRPQHHSLSQHGTPQQGTPQQPGLTPQQLGTPNSAMNSAVNTPNYAKGYQALTPQQLQLLQQQHAHQQMQQQQQYVSTFLNLDEPYYPAPGDMGQLKRKVATEESEMPPNKRARSEEQGLYYAPSPYAQSPAQYPAY